MEQQSKIDNIKTFGELISSPYLIKIPAYQRAYAWGEEQIKQFIDDLIEIGEKGYYYGHFILEKNQEHMSLEVIDGQQRITTYVLFVLSAKLYGDYDIKKEENFIINNFKTIDYDEDRFRMLVSHILKKGELLKEEKEDTSSFKRIIKAIKSFEKFFKDNRTDDNFNIQRLITALKNAHISTHTTEDKEVAVQIFELQNARGIPLDLMEKFKSRLMKTIYLYSEKNKVDENITCIQDDFARIYELEEKTIESSFRGNLTLDNILLHHLRVIDDGNKTDNLNSPALSGNITDNVLTYVTEKLKKYPNKNDKSFYILNLTRRFKESVDYICNTLIEKDKSKPLIGDCIILDRANSIEFYLLMLHHFDFDEIDLKKWELLLFTRDFHSRYYRKWYTDNFKILFKRLYDEDVNNLLNYYIDNGFRGEWDDYKLQEVFKSDVLIDGKENILKNAFNYWYHKMAYVLYKYEIENFKENKEELRYGIRQFFKKKKSIDHILPQTWKHEWIKHTNNLEEKTKFKNTINEIINGVGNLLIIDPRENSTLSNTHPEEKEYSIEYGSYLNHKEMKKNWKNSSEWEKLIMDRGQKIYEFMVKYFKTEDSSQSS